MEIEVTIKAVLSLPDGTIVPNSGRRFVLPNGQWVKPWIILEANDNRDLTLAEMETLGVGFTETEIEWFEV